MNQVPWMIPGRLWSLWEMVFEFNVGGLMTLVDAITQNIRVYGSNYGQLSEFHRVPVFQNAVNQAAVNKEIGFPLLSRQFERLASLTENPNSATYSEVVQRLESILETIADELGSHKFLIMDREAQTWFEKSPQDFFGNEVYSKFPKCRYDMEESLRCFTFERYTASVGHLTKITESAIRKMAVNILGASECKKRDFSYKSWAILHQDMVKNLKAITVFKSKSHNKKVDQQLLALDRFDTIRRTRNESHHPNEAYSRVEALDYLNHLAAFLRQVI